MRIVPAASRCTASKRWFRRLSRIRHRNHISRCIDVDRVLISMRVGLPQGRHPQKAREESRGVTRLPSLGSPAPAQPRRRPRQQRVSKPSVSLPFGGVSLSMADGTDAVSRAKDFALAIFIYRQEVVSNAWTASVPTPWSPSRGLCDRARGFATFLGGWPAPTPAAAAQRPDSRSGDRERPAGGNPVGSSSRPPRERVDDRTQLLFGERRQGQPRMRLRRVSTPVVATGGLPVWTRGSRLTWPLFSFS